MDIVVGSSLVDVYVKCDAFKYAIQMFDEMSEKDVAYYISWAFDEAIAELDTLGEDDVADEIKEAAPKPDEQ
ncbi:unnamed protein product [Lupinus luteus]|uniref:Pentatricopeptide repeat-containing protein n=1 Tax=Lupinus luteus TaxID=3873 RepID=A0AAV1Y199_LUPLU